MSRHEVPERAIPAPAAPSAPTLARRIENLSSKTYASWALFGIACVEGSVFPLPPDPLFIALSIGNPKRSFWFALISASGSVVGSLIGYAIGFALFDAFGHALLSSLGALDAFTAVLGQYREHGIMTLILAGFTPVPYAVVTIAAGFNQTLPFATLALGSLLGRAIRFGLLGGLLYVFGEPVKRVLTRRRFAMAAAMLALAVVSFLFLRWLL